MDYLKVMIFAIVNRDVSIVQQIVLSEIRLVFPELFLQIKLDFVFFVCIFCQIANPNNFFWNPQRTIDFKPNKANDQNERRVQDATKLE